jgi:predicted nucleotidyltransferase
MVKKSAINIAKKYISHLPEEMSVKRAYLFGSYANGSQTDDSDIDIAIVVGDKNRIFDLQMQLLRLRRKIDLRIEPHPIKETDFSSLNPFAIEIMQSGIEL